MFFKFQGNLAGRTKNNTKDCFNLSGPKKVSEQWCRYILR